MLGMPVDPPLTALEPAGDPPFVLQGAGAGAALDGSLWQSPLPGVVLDGDQVLEVEAHSCSPLALGAFGFLGFPLGLKEHVTALGGKGAVKVLFAELADFLPLLLVLEDNPADDLSCCHD